ncbi:DNA topoisomerase IV subunit B [Ureaplasma urealyticum]|uniref:DNA topoisomerase IV subunit B n=1 Tax=Ureaplasma urealyticum TaxID=2130 RepID=UPI00114F6566|nr:DNA topoisomerase IV subunit B [Ureaplasma urealyticum]QDI63850.1 DNA topoisomerase IV subunit B [Ureaplasma urealyticum]
MANKYDGNAIKILEGLEAVRKRPGMYIGSTSSAGLHHLVWEIVDNSIDEVMNANAKNINVILHEDNSISVLDDGRGIPVDINSQTKISTVETVLTILHAGGKFDESAYKTAGGLHGVGSSVVNALSSWLICEVYRDQKIYQAKFINGGHIHQSLKVIGTTKKTGTLIHFLPDPLIFKNLVFNPNIIKERLHESTFLIKDLKIIFEDKINKKKYEFINNQGLIDFIKFINETKKTFSDVIFFKNTINKIDVEVAFQYSDQNNEIMVSFANSVKTSEGGVHENAFKNALTSVVNNYARKHDLLKEKDKNLEGDDIREGLSSVISLRIPESLISYEGQTKNKLFTPEANEAVKKTIEDNFSFWLEENKTQALDLVNRAIVARDAKLAAKRAREETKKVKKIKEERGMGGKLTPAQSKDPTLNELFLVEGDSAGGSAKLGRNKKYQAILPLRGKVLNVLKARLVDVLKNEEIASIFTCLGTGIGAEFDLKKLKYHKIIIMTDADTDGSHIQVLLLTLFYRFMRPLIENGNIYIALPPLYKLTNKNTKKFFYAWDDVELDQLKKEQKNYEIQRYKGLGEMNADQLFETTMDPSKRLLLRVNINDILQAERQINTLMGNDVSIRRQWIDNNIDFSVIDELQINNEESK